MEEETEKETKTTVKCTMMQETAFASQLYLNKLVQVEFL